MTNDAVLKDLESLGMKDTELYFTLFMQDKTAEALEQLLQHIPDELQAFRNNGDEDRIKESIKDYLDNMVFEYRVSSILNGALKEAGESTNKRQTQKQKAEREKLKSLTERLLSLSLYANKIIMLLNLHNDGISNDISYILQQPGVCDDLMAFANETVDTIEQLNKHPKGKIIVNTINQNVPNFTKLLHLAATMKRSRPSPILEGDSQTWPRPNRRRRGKW